MAKLSEVKVDLKLNTEEVIKDLKSIQREAKKATQAMRELETMYGTEEGSFYVKWNQDEDDKCYDINEIRLSNIPTKYLQRELSKRDDGYSDTLLIEKLNKLKNERDIINYTYQDGTPHREDFIKVSNKIKLLEEIIKE